ncbi:MAG: hypothetical protein JW820_02815, partial [Spirochaetales bacterium]|nr:hypothetical protein [Spirochaetales bacterium]
RSLAPDLGGGFALPGRLAFLPLLALVALLLLLGACSSRDAAFREEFTRATAQLGGDDLLAALLALDQQHPDRLLLKVNIGALYLARSDTTHAAPYLERGRALAHRSRDPHLSYLLYGNLAELALRTERYRDSVAYADRALRLQGEDPLGVVFTRAKAHLASGAREAALADFRTGIEAPPARRPLNLEDCSAYIRALVAAGELEQALRLYRERQRRFGFVTGQGLEESALFERLGRIDEAILSAFMELEYGQARASLDREALRRNLAELSRELDEGSGNTRPETRSLLAAVDRYVEGDWQGTSAALAEVGENPPHGFLDLLKSAAALELLQAGAGADDWPAAMAEYVELEELFKDLQSYYYHLWRGMRSAPGGYSLALVQPVLEKTILLGPGAEQAAETRAELGRLLGLTPEQGRRLLLEPEIRAAAAEAVARRQPALLEPLLELLALPDTIYGLQATFVLQQAADDPAVRVYLERRRLEASGRLRERLGALLGS